MKKLFEILAIALGSFIAFAMEPLVGRALLAAFGGTAAVWVTCLVAFQILLVVGYFYAHWLGGGGRGRLVAHLAVIAVGALWCFGVGLFGDEVKAISGLSLAPALKTLLGVVVICALPFVVLSANSSLVQVLAGGNYRLYAVSNIGSLLGLAAYPFLIEPLLSLDAQWFSVGGGMLVYGVMLAALIVTGAGRERGEDAGAQGTRHEAQGTSALVWFGLSAAGVAVLNAVTAHMTGNVAPIPLLWAMLLAVYLLTFIIGFSGFGEKALPLWDVLALASAIACVWAYRSSEASQILFLNNAIAAGALLLFGCTAIHSRLYALRPHGEALTKYYLLISLGGAFGGLLSGFFMPLVSTWIIEYPIAIIVVVLAVVFVRAPQPKWMAPLVKELEQYRDYDGKIRIGIAVVLAAAVWLVICAPRHGTLAQGRSFYGAWKVTEQIRFNNLGWKFHTYEFVHSGTIHGIESADGNHRDEPTAYFGRDAGGLSFTTHPAWEKRGIRAGIIGLGVGTLAWYERPQDTFDFFEICPEVISVAKQGKWFDFVPNHKGKGQIIEGDAKAILQRQRDENAPKYDVLIVDAYSGDSIPYHLVTKEAFQLYRDRLADGGSLVLHITNWHVDLFPVAKAAAKNLGMNISIIAGSAGNLTTASNWALLSKEQLIIPDNVPHLDMSLVRDVELPTDKKGSLIGFLKF